jgi:hypothetical protein
VGFGQVEWTDSSSMSFLDGDSGHRYVLHDRDSAFSVEVDVALQGFGLRVGETASL